MTAIFFRIKIIVTSRTHHAFSNIDCLFKSVDRYTTKGVSTLRITDSLWKESVATIQRASKNAESVSKSRGRPSADNADYWAIHYCDVIMGPMAFQITSLTIVYSTVYSGADQRTYQSSATLAFVRGIHRWPVNSRTNGQWRGNCFYLMTSSCDTNYHSTISSLT